MFKKPEREPWSDESLGFLAEIMTENISDSDSDVPSGYIYFGQFIDHDITFDTTPLSEADEDIDSIRNYRTPNLDLDCLYGAGPQQQPYLYKKPINNTIPSEFTIGSTRKTIRWPAILSDLPRSPEGYALIPDPRNDENLVISQLHLAFMKFHNKVIKELKDYKLARAVVIESYQKIIQKDFLPNFVRKDILDSCTAKTYLNNCDRNIQGLNEAYIPIEFSAAAYRFGHSMIRNRYSINKEVANHPLGRIFEFKENILPTSWLVDWNRFFYIDEDKRGSNEFNLGKSINPSISSGLKELIIPDEPKALALRNLKRGNALKLPSGQEIAKELGRDPLSREELTSNLAPNDKTKFENHSFHLDTPLWYYLLREAEVDNLKDKKMGPVGSQIISEVLLGLMALDRTQEQRKNLFHTKNVEPKKYLKFSIKELLAYLNTNRVPGEIDHINPFRELGDHN